jgi:hypothetical protein
MIGRRQIAKHLMTTQGRNAIEEVLRPVGPRTPPRVKQSLLYLLAENVNE